MERGGARGLRRRSVRRALRIVCHFLVPHVLMFHVLHDVLTQVGHGELVMIVYLHITQCTGTT